MPVSEAQKRAAKKYAQTKKGQAALQRAHQKRTNTEEYRDYQRHKQAEYRRRKKEKPALSNDSQLESLQVRESFLPVNDNDFSKLNRLIESFKDNLLNQMNQQGLSYETLPLSYQAILDALHTWGAGQSDS